MANKGSNPKNSSPKYAHHSNLAIIEDKVPTVTWSRTVKAIVLAFLPLSLQLLNLNKVLNYTPGQFGPILFNCSL